MKKLAIFSFLGILTLLSCNKEPANEVSAKFTTKLVDNTAFAGETFYIYLTNCSGDFFTLFRGLTPGTTYNPDDPVVSGSPVDISNDSVAITYVNAGEYKLTLVATSSGNWGEDYLVDVYTITINVVDDRTGFLSFFVGTGDNERSGAFTPDNEILFYAHKLENISNERIKFITLSAGAQVFVGDVLQESGRTRHNFSALNPGDNEGRPVVFTVKAPSGDTQNFTARFILRDASPENDLLNISSSNLPVQFSIDQDANKVSVSYYEGAILTGKLLAVVSPGAVAKVGNTVISGKEGNVNLSTATRIIVTAEDLSTQEYLFSLYKKERITAFKFTAFDNGSELINISPEILGTVNFNARTIDIQVPKNLDLTKVVASFEGLENFTLKVEDTTLTSGVSLYDYSFSGTTVSKNFIVKVSDEETLIDTYTLTVRY